MPGMHVGDAAGPSQDAGSGRASTSSQTFDAPNDRHHDTNSGAYDHIRSFVGEIDMSTKTSVSGNRLHINSDHATPHTHKSSSNSSFSPRNVDYVPTEQQQSCQGPLGVPFSSVPEIRSTNVDEEPPLMAYQNAPGPPDSPQDSGGFENPYSMQAGWSYPIPQPRESVPPSSSGVDGANSLLNEMNWPQTPDVNNWSNWQM